MQSATTERGWMVEYNYGYIKIRHQSGGYCPVYMADLEEWVTIAKQLERQYAESMNAATKRAQELFDDGIHTRLG